MYRLPIYRISLIRESSLSVECKTFRSSREVFDFSNRYLFEHADREYFYVIALDSKNRMRGLNCVSMGSLASSIIHPREVFKMLVLQSAAAFLAVHNHPSGDCTPSREDRECTERLQQAGQMLGIKFLDHIVCGETDYYSFADAGAIIQGN